MAEKVESNMWVDDKIPGKKLLRPHYKAEFSHLLSNVHYILFGILFIFLETNCIEHSNVYLKIRMKTFLRMKLAICSQYYLTFIIIKPVSAIKEIHNTVKGYFTN